MSNLKRNLRVAAAVAMASIGAGAVATSASASWDITGGNYSVNLGSVGFTLDGVYTTSCTSTTMAGNTDNVVGEPEASRFTMNFSACNFFGLPATMSTLDPWKLVVTGGGFGGYSTNVQLESGSAIYISIPAASCSITIDGPQSFVNAAPDRSGLLMVGGPATYFTLYTESLVWTANTGCLIGTGGTASFDISAGTGPFIQLPGVNVTP